MEIVIFDMDGTLTDSRHNIAVSINYARDVKGLPALDEEVICEAINALTFQASRRFYGDEPTEEDHRIFAEHYANECLKNLRLYDGIKELLAALKSRGVSMAVATNATAVFAEKMLTHTGIAGCFKVILGADCVINPKPAPDMLLKSLALLNGEAKEAFFVGDSGKDMIAAKTAGIKSVFVKWGYGTEDSFADFIIKKPCELLAVLERPR
ncbi:MAG: HAD-IA family hydrolase [Helicobacteraceae bacterium]|jgi:phosphoglycolate phosphatase|nr:HAD-IA family hydrolase [Helicobacteraceae bacterium]